MGPQRPELVGRHPVLAPRPLAPKTPYSASTTANDAGWNRTRRIDEKEASGTAAAWPAKRTRVACRRCRRSKVVDLPANPANGPYACAARFANIETDLLIHSYAVRPPPGTTGHANVALT
jgi:hypothetical protein